jgi:hypothetical protein
LAASRALLALFPIFTVDNSKTEFSRLRQLRIIGGRWWRRCSTTRASHYAALAGHRRNWWRRRAKGFVRLKTLVVEFFVLIEWRRRRGDKVLGPSLEA